MTKGRVAAVGLLLLLSACARPGGGDPPDTLPAGPHQLVLQVRFVGGFVPAEVASAGAPLLSVYGDGRVITEGPVQAIYPGPALPNLQVQRIQRAGLRALVDRALAAGVKDTADLGRPPIEDAATTRFTVVTGSSTYVREVYALNEAVGLPGGGATPPGAAVGLTPEQVAARAKLVELFTALTDLQGTLGGRVGNSEPYAADAVAVLVTPWSPPAEDLPQQERPWPGPPLPGAPVPGPSGVTCVAATGQAAQDVLAAAGQANHLTPWTTADGSRWLLTFRPLLPDEAGCADLGG